MIRLILIRHAETEANTSRLVWQGSTDTPLTPRGEQQVTTTAARVATLHHHHAINALYASSLPRAHRTADAIGKAIGLVVRLNHDLREFDLGEWEGRTFADLEENENLSNRWDADQHFAPPGGESPYGFQQRIVTTFERLAAAHHNQTVLIVTHGGVIRNLLGLWIGDGPNDWQRWEASNCSITILERSAQTWHAQLLNDTCHLPPAVLIAAS